MLGVYRDLIYLSSINKYLNSLLSTTKVLQLAYYCVGLEFIFKLNF